jgi:hypothetical protein
MKTEEEKQEENVRFFQVQMRKLKRNWKSWSRGQRINYIKKQIYAQNVKIEHTDKIITVLFEQQEQQLARKKRLKEILNNKDFRCFEREFL